jgi:hypothetical protein
VIAGRLPTLLVALVALLGASVLAGCGNKKDIVTSADTEGIYVDAGPLQYQVQISRQLNPYDVEDSYYVRGTTEPPPGRDDTWFGVFVRVYNPDDARKQATSDFEIHDTQGNIYKPVPLDNTNVFRYVPTSLGEGQMIPTPGSPAFNSPIRGSLLLFRVKVDSFENRPLELIISQPGIDEHAEVPLDV